MPRISRPIESRSDGDARETALPPANTCHWVARRKAQVVEAIQSGRLSLEEARRRYQLSVEEFGAWKSALFRFGLDGLRAAERVKSPRRPGSAGAEARHG